MANYSKLKNIIDQVVRTNGQGDITGANLNQTLQQMVTDLGANYQYAGVAVPGTNPGTPDQNVFFIATLAGTYSYFNRIVLPKGITVLKWNGSWSATTLYTVDTGLTPDSEALVQSGTVFEKFKFDGGPWDVSAHFPTAGPNNDGKFTLDYILTNANTLIPEVWRKGGMSIRFLSSSDNKYVQYRLMAQNFTTDVTQWQGVDEVPKAESVNLVESGGARLTLNNELPFVVMCENANQGHTYYPINIKQGHTYRFQKTSDYSASSTKIYCRITKSSEGLSGSIDITTADYVDFIADKDYNYIDFYNNPQTTGGTQKIYVYDLEFFNKNVFTPLNTETTFSTNEKVKNVGIDGVPTDGSENIVKSGGVAGRIDELEQSIFGKVAFSGKHGTYINFNIKNGVSLKITNTCNEVAKLYFRKVKSSTGQEQVDAIAVNSSVSVTPSDNFPYIYIYNPDDTGYSITFTIEIDDYLAKDVTSNSVKIAQIENSIIDSILYSLRGTEQSRIVLNNAIVLSEDGDELSFDYIVDCDGYQELSFAASGLEGSPTYNYAIRLGKSTFRLRGSAGWMQASDVTFTERTKGKMRIVYADSKIYTYIDNSLIDTVDSQSTLTIKGFGYGGNNTASYGYWKGSISNVKHNGVTVNLENSATLQNVDKLVIYKFSEKKKSTLTWNASTKMFTHYELEESTNRYFSFSMQLKENADICLKEWRLVDGGCYYWDGTNFVKLFSTIYNAENEMAMMFSAGNYNGSYTGGSHGGEKIDTNANCFAKFFADGKLLTDNDLAQSFSMDCDEFSYIQVSTLHNSDDNNSVRAYHTKVNRFSDCGFHLQNTIKFTGSNTVYQFHAGLFCVAKDSATNTFIPTTILQTMSGDDTMYRADDYNATEIIFWNPTNNVKVSVTGRFLEGFTFGDALPSSGLFGVWDRSTDSKYYRRTNDSYPFSEGDVIRNEQIVKYT